MASLNRRRPAKAARKILKKRIRLAWTDLKEAGALERRVHSTRQDLKKARAILRLLRSSVDRKRFKKENALCREAGRALAPARDPQTLLRAWRRLRIDAPAVTAALQTEASEAIRRLSCDPGTFKVVAALLRRARKRASALPVREGWKAIRNGVRSSYRAGLRAWRFAATRPTDSHYHYWRKRAKDQRYQLELFDPEANPGLARLAKDVTNLSNKLGDDHDYTVLRERLRRDRLEDGGKALPAIASRQEALRAVARKLALKVYRDSPQRFERRLHRHWKAMRKK